MYSEFEPFAVSFLFERSEIRPTTPRVPTLTLTPILNSGLSLWGWVLPP